MNPLYSFKRLIICGIMLLFSCQSGYLDNVQKNSGGYSGPLYKLGLSGYKYIDANGKVYDFKVLAEKIGIHASQLRMIDYSEGVFVIKDAAGKYKYYDLNGDWLFQKEFDDAWIFKNGKTTYKIGDMGYVINRNGQVLYSVECDLIYLRNDRIIVNNDDRCIVVSLSGEKIFSTDFDSIYSNSTDFYYVHNNLTFTSSLVVEKKDYKKQIDCLVYDSNFVKLGGTSNPELVQITDQGFLFVGGKSYNFYFYMTNFAGNYILPKTNGYIGKFNDNLAFSSIGVIDTKGKVRFKDYYDKIGIAYDEHEGQFWEGLVSNDGMIRFLDGKFYGYLDQDENVAIKPQYYKAQAFRDGYAAVCDVDSHGNMNSEYKIIDKKNNIIYKHGELGIVTNFGNGIFGFIDENGKSTIVDVSNKNKVLAKEPK